MFRRASETLRGSVKGLRTKKVDAVKAERKDAKRCGNGGLRRVWTPSEGAAEKIEKTSTCAVRDNLREPAC